MTDPTNLSFLELFFLIGLIVVIGWEAIRAWNSNDPFEIYKPTVILGIILTYYCVVGPLRVISAGEWFDRGVDLRSSMVWAWGGAVAFYTSVLFGFYNLPAWRIKHGTTQQLPPSWAKAIGIRCNIIGISLYTAVTGTRVIAQLNPLNPVANLILNQQTQGEESLFDSVSNYFSLSLNLLIPGTLLLFAAWVHQRKGIGGVILWTLAAAALFTTAGFRWRLVILIVPMAMLWFLSRQRKPQLFFLTLVTVALIGSAGLIGLTRNYGIGLNLAGVEEKTASDIFSAGLDESSIFLTTGGVMQRTPDPIPYIGITPLINTAVFFIPRAIWPAKPSNEYISIATGTLYGSINMSKGAAFMNFAEYYLMFGWISLVGMSLLLGQLLRGLYNWLLAHRYDPSAQVAYSVAACFLYVVVSRGYLPQVFSLFCFTVLPLFVARQPLLSSQFAHRTAP